MSEIKFSYPKDQIEQAKRDQLALYVVGLREHDHLGTWLACGTMPKSSAVFLFAIGHWLAKRLSPHDAYWAAVRQCNQLEAEEAAAAFADIPDPEE